MAAGGHGCEEGLQAKCPGLVASPSFASSLLTEVVVSDEGPKGMETNPDGIRDKHCYRLTYKYL